MPSVYGVSDTSSGKVSALSVRFCVEEGEKVERGRGRIVSEIKTNWEGVFMYRANNFEGVFRIK